MTSTSFNVGLNDARNSSRVLRPPGGGHTPLFGPPDHIVQKKDNGRNASSITEGRSEPVAQAAPQPAKVVTPSAPVATTPENAAPVPIAPSPAAPAPAPASAAPASAPANKAPVAASQPSAAAQSRGRVPPGGFSSGLW